MITKNINMPFNYNCFYYVVFYTFYQSLHLSFEIVKIFLVCSKIIIYLCQLLLLFFSDNLNNSLKMFFHASSSSKNESNLMINKKDSRESARIEECFIIYGITSSPGDY